MRIVPGVGRGCWGLYSYFLLHSSQRGTSGVVNLEETWKAITMDAHSVVPDVVDVLPEQVIKVSSSSVCFNTQKLIECRKS